MNKPSHSDIKICVWRKIVHFLFGKFISHIRRKIHQKNVMMSLHLNFSRENIPFMCDHFWAAKKKHWDRDQWLFDRFQKCRKRKIIFYWLSQQTVTLSDTNHTLLYLIWLTWESFYGFSFLYGKKFLLLRRRFKP